MIHSLPRLLRNGAFRTAAACALVFLLAAAVPEAFSLESPSFAQSDPTVDAPNSISSVRNPLLPKEVSRENLTIADVLSRREVSLSAGVLLFAIIAIVVMLVAFRNHIRDKSEEIERFGIVTILIMGALFLITAGFSNEQIAPAYGLLGTIAGYLLGQGRVTK